jgi:exonuclease III
MAYSTQCDYKGLRIGSYNCRGLRYKIYYALQLMTHSDILLVQENWLSVEQLEHLQSVHNHLYIYGVCGFNTSAALTSRPLLFGGCAFLWRRDLNLRITPIAVDHRRICALLCTFNSINIVLINVYMPYEDNEISEDEFRLLLSIIDDIIQRSEIS